MGFVQAIGENVKAYLGDIEATVKIMQPFFCDLFGVHFFKGGSEPVQVVTPLVVATMQ